MGLTEAEVEEMMGDRFDEFFGWMHGQTMALCDGRLFNHETREYEHGCDEPHGIIIYESDARRFLLGLPVID